MTGKNLGRWICTLLGVGLIVALLRWGVTAPYFIPSAGMENSLLSGERFLVNKWSYGYRLPWMQWIGYQRWNEQPIPKEDIVVFNNPANITEPIIDQREVFIGRCLGCPGDTLLLDSLFAVIPSERLAPDQKFLYSYPAAQEALIDSLMQQLSLTNEQPVGQDTLQHIRCLSRYEHYLLEQTLNNRCSLQRVEKEDSAQVLLPLIIPGKGMSIEVKPWNRMLLYNTLLLHEHRQAEIKNDTLYVDGIPAKRCFFTQNYYWMVSNNPTNPTDSRMFGFVPHSHVIGKAAWIWFSKQPHTGWLQGFRWNRIGQNIH